MLQIRNVKKTYTSGKLKVEALKGISLDFKDTGLVFIVGKSGSGKSTLLNILGGLDKMSSGEIIIDGKSTNDFSSSDFDAFRNYYLGFIFQDFNLIDELTVYDNISLALKIQSKGHDNHTIEDALKMVGLEGLGYRKPNELSGGQRQRVSIARALVKDPRIILADEPTGALDSKTGEALIVSLKTLSKDKLVIVVTHDEEMALNYGDEIIEIKDGLVVNHVVVNNDDSNNVKEEILPNLVKYSANSQITSLDEINSKLKEDTTNYVLINTSKEIVSLAYHDAFPYIYERKENLQKFKEVKEDSLTEVKRNKEKKINNKAYIKLQECFKMAFQSIKRKKKRFSSLVTIAIASLYLFSLGWLFSSINVANIVANNTVELDIPISYVYKSNDESYGKYKLEITSEKKDELIAKHNRDFALSSLIKINYLNPSNSSSSVFSMNGFNGIVEANDFNKFNFNIKGSSIPKDKEIIITDYAASELLRTGYICNINNELTIVYPQTIDDVLNASIALIMNSNNEKEYSYYKIVGIIDTDYEKYQHLISKTITASYLNDEITTFETKKNYFYSMLFVGEGFSNRNIIINQKELAGDMLLNTSYKYNDNMYEGSLYYYFSPSQYDNSKEIRKLSESSFSDVLWGEVPLELKENQVILSYQELSSYIEIGKTLDDFMKDFSITSFDFQKYDGSGLVIKEIYKELEVVAVVDMPFDYYFVVSDKLYDSFIEKINKVQFTNLMFSIPSTKEATQRLMTSLVNEGYEIGEIVGVDSSIEELINIVGPSLIYVSIFFAFFSFLIVLNFVSSSVRSRRKEIGILRSMGARNKDILKIFGTEIFIMGCLITFITLILLNFTVNGINGTIDGLLSLTIIKDIVIFVICLLFLLISSIIPLSKILKNNPIDAIRKLY